MRNLLAVAILAMLGSAVGARAQQAVLDRLARYDLSNLAPSLADMSDLARMIGEVPKGEMSQPVPWRVWKLKSKGSPRYVVLLVESEMIIPGGSTARVVLLDAGGAKINAWSFQLGWRSLLSAASTEYSSQVGGDVIVIKMARLVNGRNIAKEYFAISHDQLRFIRMEDDYGTAVQNEYIYPNYEIGVVPDANGVDDWLKLLESTDRADVLSALMFLGGRHLAEPERRLPPDPKESKYAELFQQLAGDPRILAKVERLRQSDNPWVREAAEMAARGPRERPLH